MAAYYSAHGHGVMNMNSFKSPSIICSFSFIPYFAITHSCTRQLDDESIFFPLKLSSLIREVCHDLLFGG